MTEPVPPWQWPVDEIRKVVESTGTGPPLCGGRSTHRWPNSARAAVALSFDTDYQTLSLRDGVTTPAALALGEYGACVGLPRILRLLDDLSIPATFFVPAVSALLYPENVREIVARGFEIAAHGWIHERSSALTPAVERELMSRSLDQLEKISGRRPVGVRTPSWDFTPHTLGILQDFQLRYDSSLMARDEPYELLDNGQGTGIVEVPVNWIRDDFPYLHTDMVGASRPHTSPRQLTAIWRDEFDSAYEEGGLFQLTMHPQVMGYRSRVAALREFLHHLRGHADVWFATHEEIAAHAAASHDFSSHH